MKGRIIKIGTIKKGQLDGWEFDCMGRCPAIDVTEKGILYAGFTIFELMTIAMSGVIPEEYQ